MPASDPPRLSPSDLLDAMGEGAALLDTRPRERYLYAHLPGALFAPLTSRFEAVAGRYAPEGAPLYVVVAEEDRDSVVDRLQALGRDVRGVADAGEVEAHLKQHGGPGIKSITFQEVDGRRHYTNVAVLDVRGPEQYAERHIEGAVNVPHAVLAERLDELPSDKTLIVHCGSGGRAAVAAGLLQARGFHVIHVEDAFKNYRVRTAAEASAP